MSTMTPPSRHVSEHILSPLRRIARRHTLLVAVRCLLQLITIGLLLLLAIALLLGNFRDLTPFLRIPVALLTWSGIVVLAYYAIRPMFHGWSVDRAALEIEHSLPQVQERISSAVELSSDTDARYRASESLISHLIGQAEEDAGNIQPQMVVRPRGLLLWSGALAPVLVIWTVAILARPLTMEAGLFRVFMPWKTQLPAFLASISVSPGNSTINQGEPLTITLNVSREAGSISDAPGQATLVKRFTSGQVLSQDLSRAGKLQFTATLSNVEQGFTYRVDSAAGQSPWYTVTVNARPAITGIDLSYEFPKYTGIAPKTVSAPDGAIEAVVGTKVGITVHSTQALGNRSRLTLDPGTPDAADLPLIQTVPGKNDYQATLPVRHNGMYHFVLVNTVGLEGLADEPRTITAHPDQPPTIAILTPHQGVLTVRNDDVVPIRYRAGDDFAVQKIQALLAVDDKEIAPFELIFDPTDRRDIRGEYDLSVAAILKRANVASAHQITYQFEAWDNRDPNPQSALTVKQSLDISEQPILSYEARLAAADADNLMRAIQEAIDRLNEGDNHVRDLQHADPAQPLRPDELHWAESTKNLITKTATDLTDAADDAMSTDMANVAAQAEDIAAHPITGAAQSIAKGQLDASAGSQRQADFNSAHQQTADAITKLRALLDTVKKTEERTEAASELAQAAKDQQQAAQEMASADEQAAKNQASQQKQQNQQSQQDQQKAQQQAQQEQQKADQELQQAMNQDPGLKQDQQAQSTADKLNALQQKIDALHDQQEGTAQATAQQKAPDASKLAAAQKALNEQIQQFEKQQQEKLQQTQTNPPSADQQNQIVNDLTNNQTASAAEKMQNSTNQLNATAQKLQKAAATSQPFTAQQQSQLTADQQAQDAAKNAQNQAEQAATTLNQQTQQPAANDPTIQQAQQAAQAIQQQAQSIKPQGNDAKDSQNNAEQQAAQAAADAQAAQNAPTPADAAKDMQQAAQQLRHAADALVQAQQQNTADQQQAMQQQQAQATQQAAAQAQSLAQQQQALLQQDQPNEQAAKDEAAQQQQIAQTAQDAQQLQQSAQTDQDDDVAQRAGDAQKAVQQAANEAQQAANSEHNNQPEQAAQHEKDAAHQLAMADNALRGQPPQQEAQADQPADPHQAMDDQQPQQGQQDQQQANAKQNEQGQHQDQAEQNEKGQHEQGQHEQSADAAHHDAADAADEAQHAQEEAGHGKGEQAQHAAQEAANELAKASQEMENSIPGQEEGHQSEPAHDGMQRNSNQGSATVAGAGDKPEPAAVVAVGISARDWAKLRPLAQQDLLNASQQNSLPAYRESIKNYFEKIARLKDSTASQQQGND